MSKPPPNGARPTETPPSGDNSSSNSSRALNEKHTARTRHDSDISKNSEGKFILKETDCEDKLGFQYPNSKKWLIITVIFLVQTSMNFNASVYGNAVAPLIDKFGISAQTARLGQMAFLVAYAFGCELWAPWSEELGRKKVLQWSLGLVNLWQIPCALASMYGNDMRAVAVILTFRTLGGLSSAGGSVTLGMVADMWGPDDQQYAVAFVVFSSVGGSIFGPVIGGFLQQYTALYWNFWAQLIMGAIVQAIHFFYVPETRTSCLVTAEAKRRRSEGETNVYSEGEINHRPFLSKEGMKHCIKIWIRPFKMFIFEPIVLWLSLISGFSDALIFTFLDSTGLVYGLWEFTPSQIGLVFLAIGFGYILAYGIWARVIRRQNKIRKTKNSKKLEPEARLTWLLWTAPLLVVGIFCFAGTSTGPPLPWIASVLFLILIGIANYAIYGATIDYMVAAYGAYSASATGGNGFARDFLAGIAAIYAHPLYTRFGDTVPEQLRNGSFLLGGIGLILLIPIYVFWWYGPKIREKSKFATKLDNERKQKEQSLPLTSKEGSSGIDRGQGVLE